MNTFLKIFQWLPRIICILAILFVSIFAADAFEAGNTAKQQLAQFFIHLIPSFLLLVFLLLAWRRELIGGIIFIAIGIVMTPVIFSHNYTINHFSVAQCIRILLMITFPFIVTGILFIVSYFMKQRRLL